MKVSTRIHRINLSGGYLDKLPDSQKEMFKTKANPCSYYSEWDEPSGMKREEWKEWKEGKTPSEIFEVYPKYEDLSFNVQDEELLDLMLKCNNRVTVLSSDDVIVEVESGADLAEEYFLKTMTIMEKYQTQLERFSENTFNEKCGVHTGGNALTEYNQLMLCEDICTDELQSKLVDGWRIVAVCPQPDQRRPDYILGKKVDIPQDSAKRY